MTRLHNDNMTAQNSVNCKAARRTLKTIAEIMFALLEIAGTIFTIAAALIASAQSSIAAEAPRLPNIVFFLADDLGVGDLSCYGQKKYQTPHADRLATEGMRFTQAYAGHNVCAPSRCALMTGLHPGHGYIRDNEQASAHDKRFKEGQVPVPANYLALPLTFKKLGYTIGGFGKWGLGPVGSTGDPLKQGFDRFFGYNCQAVAHNYYPTHLWDNDHEIALNNRAFSAHQKFPPSADSNDPAANERYVGKDVQAELISQNRPLSSSDRTKIGPSSCTIPRPSRTLPCRKPTMT